MRGMVFDGTCVMPEDIAELALQGNTVPYRIESIVESGLVRHVVTEGTQAAERVAERRVAVGLERPFVAASRPHRGGQPLQVRCTVYDGSLGPGFGHLFEKTSTRGPPLASFSALPSAFERRLREHFIIVGGYS